MRTLIAGILTAVVCLGQGPNTLTKEEKKAGWKLLFDGKTMKSFEAAPEDAWAVEDGCLKALKRPRLRMDLVSKESFQDFELAFEWKVEAGSNSGVKYLIQDSVLVDDGQLPQKMGFEKQVGYFLEHRTAKAELVKKGSDAQVYPVAFEYQVIDDAGHSDALHNVKSRAGALYRMVAPTQAMAKAVGEWNQARIVVRGMHAEHWLNGVKVVDTDLKSAEIRTEIEKRWPVGHPVHTLLTKIEKGRAPISFQNHNDVAWFRNVKIRPMKP